jgi:protein disulfide-isomerase A1
LKDNKNILIAKIDGTKNEVDGYTVKGFPTIRLYKSENKDNSIDYTSAREVEDLINFLKKETKIY